MMAPEEDEIPDCRLDVTSESFDPLLALYSAATPLPFPDVRCFNNLAEYESFLQRGGRPRSRSQKPVKKGRKPAPDPERVQRLMRMMVPPESGAEKSQAPRRGRREPRNVLTRMALQDGSPVGRLYRCVQERLRVHVHTRTFRGLRGVCSGFIVAFDKFWNLAMVDVDETYRRPVLGRAFYSQPALTLPRLLARLRLQEEGPEGAAGKPDYQPGKPDYQRKKEMPDYQRKKEMPDYQRKKDRPDYPKEKDYKRQKEKPDYSKDKTDYQRQEKPDYPKEKTDYQRQKEKPDYQRVYTRHIQQVFIRGENVLLVHIPE